MVISRRASREETQAIVGIHFGTPEKQGRTLRATQRIGNIIHRESRNVPVVPIIISDELRGCLSGAKARDVIQNRRADCGFSVYDFFEVLHANYPDLHKIMFVTHPDHFRLCAVVARKFGIKLLAPHDLCTVPYEQHAREPWARSKWHISLLRWNDHNIGHFWWQHVVIYSLVFTRKI